MNIVTRLLTKLVQDLIVMRFTITKFGYIRSKFTYLRSQREASNLQRMVEG